jgi:glycosyltransferase involved in cell wall biosynthesis
VLVTVAICTRNRCRALERTLDALSAVVRPPSLSWEVLVVDNASEDDTAQSVVRFAESLPLRVLSEAKIGLSQARNAAIAASRGEYILWIDDDVLVDPQWLSAYHEAFRAWPDAVFFGGPIVPEFEGTPPPWLPLALPHVANAYASLDLGLDTIALTGESLPFGANFVVRAREQRLYEFDPALGRRDEQLLAGEEWAVLEKLLARGATGRWVPGARVRHVIPISRQSIGYLRRYYTGNGMSLACTRRVSGESMLFGRPRWAWREAVTQEIAYRAMRVLAQPERWSEHLRRASIAWGLLRVRGPATNDQSSSWPGGGR